MLKCPKCKRQTEKGETTGKFRILVFNDPKDKSKGIRIISEKNVCCNCSGEKLTKS